MSRRSHRRPGSQGRVFSSTYTRFYDDAYASKDYSREALRVHRAIQSYRPGAQSLAELGCGTGGHARFLARWYRVLGFERSGAMLAMARTKLRGLPVRLLKANIVDRSDFGRGQDAIVSLFHVLNYLTKEELETVVGTVATSLSPGGVFVFDSWNGAALLRHPPRIRTRSFRSAGTTIFRQSTPVLDWLSSSCEVRITLRRTSQRLSSPLVVERHRMRYYLPSELTELLAGHGFSVRRISNDLGRPLSMDDWSMRFVATLGSVE